MNTPQKYRFSFCNKISFPFVICLLLFCISLFESGTDKVFAKSTNKLKTKRHRHAASKHKRSAEEDLAAKEAAEKLAQETKLNEGRNSILAKAYRLYDSGTSEYLQGNYKYAILQLKLADELLQEHGQANTSLAIANLMSLTTAAQAAKEYVLAKTTCQRLIISRPQDTEILLKLAKIEMAQGNIHAAQNTIAKVTEIAPANAEAQLMNDLAVNKPKPVKK